MDPAGLTDEERELPRHPDRWYRKYGITFVDPYAPDLEFLRAWRNHPDIRRWMVMRDEITPEMQDAWFRSINWGTEAYSMVWNHEERIGLTQLRHIDKQNRSAEGGIIIFKPEHQNGLLPYRVALAGMDWNFLGQKLDLLTVTVLKTNSRARRLVRSLGYVLHDPDPAGETLRGEVTGEQYFRAAAKWRAIVREDAAAQPPGDVAINYG